MTTLADRIGRAEQIAPARVLRAAGLTPSQRDIILDLAIHPQVTVYSLGTILRIEGELDTDRWIEAMRTVARGEEAARLRIALIEGIPYQYVDGKAQLEVAFVDLRAATAAEQEAALCAFVKRPYDLGGDLLARTALVQFSARRFAAVLAAPHAVLDAYSGSLFFQRVAAAYHACPSAAAPSFLERVPQIVARFDAPTTLAYWSQHGADLARISLPAQGPAGSEAASAGLGIEQSAVVREAARRHGVGLAAYFRAVVALLADRYAYGDEPLCFRELFAGREDARDEPLIGCLFHTVPVLIERAALDPAVEPRALLGAMRAYRRGLGDRQYVSMLAQKQHLRTSGLQLFYNYYRFAPIASGRLRFSFEILDSVPSGELHVVVADTPAEIRITVHHATAALDPRRVALHVAALARSLAGAKTLADASMLSATELTQDARRNDTARSYQLAPLPELVERHVRATPDAVAVIDERTSVTFAELDQRAGAIAAELVAAGVRPATFVGVYLERSANLVAGLLGILKAGAAYVPLDPAYPPDRIRFMLADSGVATVLSDARLAQRLPGTAHVVDIEAAQARQHRPGAPIVRSGLDDPAYMIYTSGSTGGPKGAVNSHRGIANRLLWMQERFGLSARDRVLHKTPLGFDVSVWELFWPLAAGAMMIVARPGGHQDPQYLAELIEREGITTLHFVPSLLRVFLDTTEGRHPALRTIVCSGEALGVGLAHEAHSRYPHARLCNLYGPTEAAIDVTAWEVDGDEHGSVPIGYPVANTRIYVLDRRRRTMPPGFIGELYIAGAQVGSGYHGRVELTAARFVADPYSDRPAARMYATGDLGYAGADGALRFVGRADDQLKLRGVRIEPGEVEAALRLQPGVGEALVVARGERLMAYVRSERDAPRVEDLRRALERALPPQLVPDDWMVLDEFPLLPNGKIDRLALPAPRYERAEPVAPRSDVERELSEIWGGLLGIERPGIEDNFFHSGGHSLLATRLAAAARRRFGVELPLRAIFDAPTIAGTAAAIEAARANGAPAAVTAIAPASRAEPLALSFAQEAVWFFQELTPGLRAYQFQTAFGLVGPLDLAALRRAIDEIVRRHEIYRTTFERHDGRPVQRIHEHRGTDVPLVDLSGYDAGEREARYAALVRAEIAPVIALDRLPLIRWIVVRFGAGDHRLLEIEHHFVHDGWSINVFIRELLALYADFTAGRPSSLPALQVQFADYAAWQRQVLQGAQADAQLAYWKERLADAPAQLALPTDRPRPAVQTYDGASFSLELDGDACDALRDFGRSHGTTLFMTMLAAFYVLLARYSGGGDICVGTSIANRQSPELADLIGMVINMLALRCDLSDDPTVAELLTRVRETTLGAYANQDVPFNRVVEAVAPARSAGHLPLYQVAFSFHDAPLGELRAGELELVPGGPINNGTAKYDVNLIVVARHEQQMGGAAPATRGVTIYWEYNSGLYDQATMERMSTRYRRLLERLTHDPQRRVGSIPLGDEAEERRLASFNDTRTAYPRDASLPDLFAAMVRCHPERVALAAEPDRITYRELDRRSNACAHLLRSRGVAPGACVALLHERGIDAIVALLAVIKTGAAYLPLDPAYPPGRIAGIVAAAGAALVMHDAHLAAALAEIEDVALLEAGPSAELVERFGDAPVSAPCGPDSLAYVIFTSGSTGVPKGIEVTHRNVVRLVRDTSYVEVVPEDRVAHVATTAFDAATFEIWGALLNGARLEIVSKADVLEARTFAPLLRERGISVLFLTTALFNRLVAADPAAFVTVRVLLFGGEQVDPDAVRSVLRHGGPRHFLHVYGPTECTTFATSFPIEAVAPDDHTVPIGFPIANTTAFVLSPYGQQQPVDVPGELYLGGDGLARGYRYDAELTAQRFVPSAYGGGRLYRTGDIVKRLPSGALEFLGRADFQVKLRGYRIELGEIDAVLRSWPGVGEVATVVAEPSPGDKRLVAYLSGVQAVDTAALREHLGRRLPPYMVPAEFVVLERMPMTAGGKIDRSELHRAPALQPSAMAGPLHGFLERALASIWSDVLDLEVGRDDNFFEVGGHSLLATQVVARTRELLSADFPLKLLFEAPTIAELAEALLRRADQPAQLVQSAQRLCELLGQSEDELRNLLAANTGLAR